MKSIFYLLTILFLSLLLSCSEEPPTGVDENVLAKKKGGAKVKYSTTLELTDFTADCNYPPDPCESIQPPTEPPAGLSLGQYTTITVSAESKSRKGGSKFDRIVLVIYPDIDRDGSPDEDLEDGNDFMVVYVASVGEPTYVYSETDLFYWWGQEIIFNRPVQCYRILQDGEQGQYLAKINLRLANRGVYGSTLDPDFQSYPGIEQGYVPFEVY